ncbi:MAG: FAD-dependent oxidoreductase [Armatimonadetes bacterium]|nr:FAD-dependent oxidoreductase [Armatimonadota bacterium]
MKVAIVGLGIAGLRAAMLLEASGATVELYEARGRPGGRLHTIDEGGGAIYEAGGEWIDSDHNRVLSLLSEFNLEPDPKSNHWPGRVVYRGKSISEDSLWSDAMEDDLRVEAAAKEMCRELKLPAWDNPQHKELDERTLEHFLREHTQSERGLWWVTSRYRSDEGDDPENISLLGWLSMYKLYVDRDGDVMSAFRFPGGARSLCESMLGKIQGQAHFGKVLRKVHQDPLGVTLTFDGGVTTKVDKAILTLPPPALERVVFEPALSVQKRCAVEACRMSRAIKIVWQFKEAWWRDQGWGGGMHCDGPLQQTWDGGLGEAPILTAYVCGREAAEWVRLGDPVRAGVFELAKIYPEAAKTFERGWVHNWIGDSFAHGAFSSLAPGYVLEFMQHIGVHEGNVHFAGEHTANWAGFIEGALESAERVHAELIEPQA